RAGDREAARGRAPRRRRRHLPGRARQGRDADPVPRPAAVPHLLGCRRAQARRRREEDRQGGMMRAMLRAAFAALLCMALTAAAKEPPSNKALNALFEREFKLYVEEHPETATFF